VTYRCSHCGQKCGDYDGGYGGITGPDGKMLRLCHPNAPGRPDCYRRVTVYHEVPGVLRDVKDKPAGIDGAPIERGQPWQEWHGGRRVTPLVISTDAETEALMEQLARDAFGWGLI
jgi:hypothetical protein